MTTTEQPPLPLDFNNDLLLTLLADTRRALTEVTKHADHTITALTERIGELEEQVINLQIGLAAKGLLSLDDDDRADLHRVEMLGMLEEHWRIGR